MLALENARLTVNTSISSSSTSRMLSACSSMGRLLGIGRPGEPERRAAAELGLHPGLAAVALDDLADHRQADAGALDLVAALQGLEQAPDLVGELARDADAVVGDRELPAPAAAPGGHGDRELAAGVVLDRVADQVEQDLLELDPRGEQLRQRRGELQVRRGGWREQLPGLGDQRARVDADLLLAVAAGAAVGEDAGDQVLQPADPAAQQVEVVAGLVVEPLAEVVLDPLR